MAKSKPAKPATKSTKSKPATKRDPARKPAQQTKSRAPVAVVASSVCHACGSTERTGYVAIRTMAYQGQQDGRPFTHILWKRTTCKKCSRPRVDKYHENRG